MQYIGSLPLPQLTTVFAILMALFVIRIRMRAANRPTSLRKIMIPPFAMSTGFIMFVSPAAWIPWPFVAGAVLVGLLFAYPLIATSHFEVRDGDIYLKRSKAFVFILLGLLVLRMALHSVVEQYISLFQTGAVFFILAFSMILPWRIAMVRRFRKVTEAVGDNK